MLTLYNKKYLTTKLTILKVEIDYDIVIIYKDIIDSISLNIFEKTSYG